MYSSVNDLCLRMITDNFYPREIHISDYTYELPESRIAKYPLSQRDRSKLLIHRAGQIAEDSFSNITSYLPSGTLMVFNNTRVIRARLHFRKESGGVVEIFLLEPYAPADYQESFSSYGTCTWICLVGGLKKWKTGMLQLEVQVGDRQHILRAERLSPCGTGHEIHFSWDSVNLSFGEMLEACGELPIPPYLNRDTEENDLHTYQTVYSKIEGSVAAPTAGLHFTETVLNSLDSAGIERDEITLHVGAGTFKPVKSEYISEHEMHAEWIYVKRNNIENLLRHGGQCIAVGTTSVRTLESLYYIGRKLSRNPHLAPAELNVGQWEPYDETAGQDTLTTSEALQNILNWMDNNKKDTLHVSTRIMIVPGFRYRVVRAIVTNFHQPGSTLLLLVSAFVGGNWRNIYNYALSHDFRFLSYGDSSLLFPSELSV